MVPEINGYIDGLRKSQKFVIENRAVFERERQSEPSAVQVESGSVELF